MHACFVPAVVSYKTSSDALYLVFNHIPSSWKVFIGGHMGHVQQCDLSSSVKKERPLAQTYLYSRALPGTRWRWLSYWGRTEGEPRERWRRRSGWTLTRTTHCHGGRGHLEQNTACWLTGTDSEPHSPAAIHTDDLCCESLQQGDEHPVEEKQTELGREIKVFKLMLPEEGHIGRTTWVYCSWVYERQSL